MVLGRYMDPYGCEAIMQNQKHLWSKWYTTFLLAAGTSAVLGVDAVFIFLVLPVFAVWYLSVRHNRRAKYDYYWAIQQRTLKSGQPEWVPFDRERMKSLSKTPLAVWP
jgi:Na+-transporting methylmalonyl-CoA/oxaloacetate decarboxylase gamma subunit